MGTDGPRRPQESPGDVGYPARRAQRGCRMVRRTQAQLLGIMGAGQGRLREKLRSAEAILRQGKEGTVDRRGISGRRLRREISRPTPTRQRPFAMRGERRRKKKALSTVPRVRLNTHSRKVADGSNRLVRPPNSRRFRPWL